MYRRPLRHNVRQVAEDGHAQVAAVRWLTSLSRFSLFS